MICHVYQHTRESERLGCLQQGMDVWEEVGVEQCLAHCGENHQYGAVAAEAVVEQQDCHAAEEEREILQLYGQHIISRHTGCHERQCQRRPPRPCGKPYKHRDKDIERRLYLHRPQTPVDGTHDVCLKHTGQTGLEPVEHQKICDAVRKGLGMYDEIGEWQRGDAAAERKAEKNGDDVCRHDAHETFHGIRANIAATAQETVCDKEACDAEKRLDTHTACDEP